MTPKQPLDFAKVESLRRHMLLTTTDMSKLFGVSRMTYYGWVRGQALRPSNDQTVRNMLRRLLTVMNTHHWPTPDVIAATQRGRFEKLNAVLVEIK